MSRLGCVADDFTGATDLGAGLAATGRRAVPGIGPPEWIPADTDAVVVALLETTGAAWAVAYAELRP
ncbi:MULTISPECIES: four-carbon acid sugar kinase family protein [Streptomyces]|uniref:Putative sugar-binding N-terminal domain-containing protein n=1 Tax=Streptomyces melanosporofaciens TaxID=67327 RepID=A0A1H4W167_STRMJ|nr:four-carbon acid sugar kinase family protein [Streptomyces melanosporofaciens]SEC87119.1 Putative sugar-binding N-terminal domain-containing protein [Streptomyces melanosporofaciens]